MVNGSYLIYVISVFFTYSGVQHILWCVFALFVFVLCTLCFQFLWIVNVDYVRYSLVFIETTKLRFIFDRCFIYFYIHKSIIDIMKFNFFCIFTKDLTLSLNVFRQAITLVINYKEKTLLQI